MSAAIHHEAITDLTGVLRRDTARARVAHTHLVADQQKAWSRYAHAVAGVLEQLERDLEEGKATLETQRAARAAERTATLQAAIDRARASLEDLRVQGDLLAMEARDRLEPVRETARNALTDVRGAIERLAGLLRHDETHDG
jgi:hypothetical protein